MDYNDLNNEFENYIDKLKVMDIDFKRKELLSNIKELIYIFDLLAKEDNINLNYLKSKEILDIENEDDFLEAAIVYVEVAKNIIGEYLNKKLN